MKGSIQPPCGGVWGKTFLRLPSGSPTRFRNLLTDSLVEVIDGGLLCREIFAGFPVALLINE
jgi:hypothetical protein